MMKGGKETMKGGKETTQAGKEGCTRRSSHLGLLDCERGNK